jgi:DNA-binding Xre family transcriptional regulator
MAAKTLNDSVIRRTFLLDKAKKRPERFSSLHPEIISSLAGLRNSLAHATKDSLWISYEKDLTEALLRTLSWPARSLGVAVLVHAMNPQTLPALASCFKRFAFATGDGFLVPDELAEALEAENCTDLFIGGSIDQASQTITLWRGNLESLTVPFSAFEKSGDGIEPNFDQFSVTDYGQTIRLGSYEAAADAILYEYDPEYRRRISKERQQSEQSFGASLRRLRKQRGMRREDFGPDVTAKTIARIEQGKVQRIHKNTINAIAKRLHVRADDIPSF